MWSDAAREAAAAARQHGATQSGGQPVSSNADAARALTGALMSTMAPVHPAMAHSSDRAAPGPVMSNERIHQELDNRRIANRQTFGDNGWGRALKRTGRR